MLDPLLVLDSRERWRPVPVETVCDVGASLITADGHRSPLSTIAQLEQPGMIDFPANMTQPKDAPLVGYHRALHIAGTGLWWHQFWTFWLYNPKKYATRGAHEGDYELVQTACLDEAGDHPVLMTCSAHHGGSSAYAWKVPRKDGHPIVYVARGSHANYFTRRDDVVDIADGKGPALQLEWRSFGAWAHWNGRWGHSATSPESPGRQHHRWNTPHEFHADAELVHL